MSTESGDAVVVGFHSTSESIGALRWAIEKCRAEQRPLLVIHASSVPIGVDNGPSSAIAHRLGNPTWATVHTVVSGLDAPPDAVTRVRSGDVVERIHAEAEGAALVVLGPKRRRLLRARDTQRQLQALLECPVIRIDERTSFEAPLVLTADRPDLVAV